MIHYTFSAEQPNSHYIDIEILISNCKGNELQLQLPAWRPGRYELGNFAKNIKKFEAMDVQGNLLPFTKLSKDLWTIRTGGASMVKAKYSYYAAEINAGSSYLDDTQLYVNPVNCCMYVPDKTLDEHIIELKIPADYKVAGSLKKSTPFTLHAESFDELADSPFIASADINTFSFFAKDLPVHLHFTGECNPDTSQIITDFKKFTEHTIGFFGDVPVSEYHFLFQILPYKFYHGVEHLKSTVIAIGPGYHLMHGNTYEDVLGVSCHEFFHLWNIKTIRPAAMLPYNFTGENYARTGYVYEGFTTYYGDLLLLQSGVFTVQQYFKTLEERLNKHFHNYGRFNLSLADSSFDTWLDGYVPGAPYRKVSIYDEGNLFAFMLDVNIMDRTDGKKSLQDVCKRMYLDLGRQKKGYQEEDIIQFVNEVSGSDLSDLFTRYCYGTENYLPELERCAELLGLELHQEFSGAAHETLLGFKISDGLQGKRVVHIAPQSPSYQSGLMTGDEILAVNGKFCKMDAKEWTNYYLDKNNELCLTVLRGGELKSIAITVSEKRYFPVSFIEINKKATERKLRFRNIWSGTQF